MIHERPGPRWETPECLLQRRADSDSDEAVLLIGRPERLETSVTPRHIVSMSPPSIIELVRDRLLAYSCAVDAYGDADGGSDAE
jgi:hypothetical protein